MAGLVVRAGARSFASFGPLDDGRLNSVALALSEDGSGQRWRIELHGETEDGRALLGVLRTVPGEYRQRVIAQARCPGVRTWHVLVEAFGEVVAGASAELKLAACEEMAGAAGVQPLRGAVLEGEHTGYSHDTANADGATAVPAGAVVTHVAAFAGAGGGSVTIGALAAIPVPADAAWELPPDAARSLATPVTITFAGVVGRFVSWRL